VNIPQQAIGPGLSLILVTWYLIAKKCHQSSYLHTVIPLLFHTFNLVWMNICIRDLLAPHIVLDKSDITMFEHQNGVLIIAVLLS